MTTYLRVFIFLISPKTMQKEILVFKYFDKGFLFISCIMSKLKWGYSLYTEDSIILFMAETPAFLNVKPILWEDKK